MILLQCLRSPCAWKPQGRQTAVPQTPGIALAFAKIEAADLASDIQTIHSVGLEFYSYRLIESRLNIWRIAFANEDLVPGLIAIRDVDNIAVAGARASALNHQDLIALSI